MSLNNRINQNKLLYGYHIRYKKLFLLILRTNGFSIRLNSNDNLMNSYFLLCSTVGSSTQNSTQNGRIKELKKEKTINNNNNNNKLKLYISIYKKPINSRTEKNSKKENINSSSLNDWNSQYHNIRNQKKKPHNNIKDNRLWSLCYNSAMSGLSTGMARPCLPILATSMSLSPLLFGAALSSTGFFRLLFAIPSSVLVDKWGRKPLLVYGAILGGVGITFQGYCLSFVHLLLCRSLIGCSGVAQSTGSNVYLSDISNVANRARTFAPSYILWELGYCIGPLISGFLVVSHGLTTTYLISGSVLILMGIWNIRYLPETLPFRKKEMNDIFKAYNPSVMNKLLKSNHIIEICYLTATISFLQRGVQFCLLPLILTNCFGFSIFGIGYMYSFFSLINIIINPISAYISDNSCRRAVIIPGAIILFMSSILLGYMTLQKENINYDRIYDDTINDINKQNIIWVLLFMGIGSALIGSAPLLFICDKSNEKNKTRIISLHRLFQDLGGALGPLIIGGASQFLGNGIPVIGASLVLLFTTLRFWFR